MDHKQKVLGPVEIGEEYILKHYASPYYDPAKAHDYYMRTRQLAEKNAKSELTSKGQREVFAVSKENIAKAKKTDIEKSRDNQEARLENMRETAKAAVESINKSLSDLASKLRQEVNEVKLIPIPADASPTKKAFIQKQNATIKANAAKGKSEEFGLAARQAARDRQRLVTDLSSAVKTAREDYQTAMENLQKKYQTILETEKQNIHNYVAGAPAKKTTTKKR